MSKTPQDTMVLLCGHPQDTENHLNDVLKTLNVHVEILTSLPSDDTTLFKEKWPCILIVDGQQDLAKWLELIRRSKSMMVVTVDEDDEARYIDVSHMHVDYILEKPFNPRLLVHKMRHIVDRWRHVIRSRQIAEKIQLSKTGSGYALFVKAGAVPEVRWNQGYSFLNSGEVLNDHEMFEVSGNYHLVHDEDRQAVKAADLCSLNGDPQIVEYRLLRPDGMTVYVQKQSQIEHVEDGHFVYVTLERLKALSTSLRLSPSSHEHHNIIEMIHSTAITLSSTLDFSTVLDRMLDSAARVIPFEFADVMLVEDDTAKVVRHRGYEQFGLSEAINNVTLSLKENAILRGMAETGKPERIPDVTRDPRFQLPEEIGIVRSYLGIPIYVGERLAGFLHFNHTHTDFFTAEHQDYAAIISGQISVAISNAQLYEIVTRHSVELEQRIHDLIIIHDIGKTLQATLDVKQIYRMTYTEVICRTLVDARMDVLLYDTGTHTMNRVYAIDPNGEIDIDASEPLIQLREKPITPEEKALSLALHTFEPRIFENVIYQPLVSQDHVVGVLKITHPRTIHLDEVELTLLSTVVGQVAIAIENARLYATVQEQIAELTSLYVATTALFNSDDVAEIARQITDSICEQFNQPNCSLYLIQSDGQTIVEIAQSGSYIIEDREPLKIHDEGLIPESIRNGSVSYAADLSKHGQNHHAALTRSEIVVPLNSQHGTIGVLDLQSPYPDDFDERDLRVLQAFAERAAAVIENRRLYDLMEQRVQERTAKLQVALLHEREASDMKSRFVQNVSHQFRTPLTAILTAGQMLERYNDRMTDEERQIRYDTIRRAVAEMERLIDDSVSMSRASEGLMEFQPSAIDVGSITRTIVEDFQQQERDYPQTFTFYQLGDCQIALLDVQLWHRIVKELLLNAAKYSHSNSEITCTIECDDNDLMLTIQDHGVGIPAKDLPHIFDIFHRGANVSNIYGSGLGLSIVNRAVELHGGTIKIESEVNEGTWVKVSLPKYATKVIENDDKNSGH